MNKQVAMRLKKLASIYRVNGLESGRRPVTEWPSPTPSTTYLDRVRARIEQDARACASVVAVDLTSFEGDHVAWFACVNRLITELASGGEEYLVEMLEDRRFVIFMPGAWEGEAVKLVRTLRTALWRYMPAFSVAPVTVSVGIAEVIGSVLAKAHRASTGSASVDFGGQTAPASKLMPMAA